MNKILGSIFTIVVFGTIFGGCWGSYSLRHREVRPRFAIPEIFIVPTRNPQMRYLVDTKRRLCFMQFQGYRRMTITPVDCRKIPEAMRVFAKLDRRGAPKVYPDHHHRDAPTPPTPNVNRPPVPSPPGPTPKLGQDKPSPPTVGPNPTAISKKDMDAVKKIFPTIICLSRKGKLTEALMNKKLASVNLTHARYRQTIDHLSKDKGAWTALSKSALKTCR